MYETIARDKSSETIFSDPRFWLASGFALLAVIVRLSLLSVHGRLTGLSEYDDGVYLGAALRLVEGVLPYKDYVLVQPPGIAVLLSPIGLVAKAIGSLNSLIVMRLVTVAVSALNVLLVGHLVKSKGKVAVIAACGIMALYPQAVASSVTILLEPYMNLFCILGFVALFNNLEFRGSPRSYLLGGVLIGIAGSIKSWAIVPAVILFVVILLSENVARISKAVRFAFGVAASFLIVTFPFVLSDPSGFIHDVITVQLNRVPGKRLGMFERLNYITGSSVSKYFLSHQNIITIVSSILAIAMFFFAIRSLVQERNPLLYFGLIAVVVVFAVLLYPSDFYYHYPDFLTPYMAIVLAFGACYLAEKIRSRSSFERIAVYSLLFYVLPVSFFIAEVSFEHHQIPAIVPKNFAEGIIPKGACVVSDTEALLIESNRFYSDKTGCPVMIDSFGTALALSGGRTIHGGAAASSKLDQYWLSTMKHADYIWLSTFAKSRLPWTKGNLAYFNTHYKRVSIDSPLYGTIFKRI